MKRAWSRWVALWDHREPATSIALVRIGVGLVLVADYLTAARLGVAGPIWTLPEHGGFAEARGWLDGTTLFPIACVAAVLFAAGLLTRVSGAVLLLASAQLATIMPISDRGIDQLLRCALVILIFSPCGATLSLDALLRHGRFARPDALEPGWARRLLIVQIVWLYFCAALHKLSPAWTPADGFSALFYILHDPHFAYPFAVRLADAAPFLTRVATGATVAFEWTAPLVLVSFWRDWRRFRAVWIALGITFHLGLAATMRLGIFPFGCLALYPALFLPSAWGSTWGALTARVRAPYVSRA